MATRKSPAVTGNGPSPGQGRAATISRYSSSVKARRVSVVTLPALPTVRATFAAAASSGASLIVTMSYRAHGEIERRQLRAIAVQDFLVRAETVRALLDGADALV